MKALLILGLASILLVAIAFRYTSAEIRDTTDERVALAVTTAKADGRHDLTDAGAMLAYINSDAHAFAERDQMVWAIGYVGDQAIADELKKLLTGKPCDHPHEKKRTGICQYELQKAIDKIEDGILPMLRHESSPRTAE